MRIFRKQLGEGEWKWEHDIPIPKHLSSLITWYLENRKRNERMRQMKVYMRETFKVYS